MQRDLKPSDYISVLKKRKFGFIFAFSAFFISAMIFLYVQTPVYRATAVVKIDTTYLTDETASPADAAMVNVGDLIKSEMDEMLSPDTLSIALERVGLIKKDLPEETRQALVLSYARIIKLTNPASSRDITIDVDMDSAARAAAVANSVANTYKELYLRRRTVQMRQSRKFLKAQVEKAKKDLERSEQNLTDYKKENSDDEGPGAETVTSANGVSGLENKLSAMGEKIADIEREIGRLERLRYSASVEAISEFDSLSSVRSLLTELQDVKRQISSMEQDYTDKYVELSDLRAKEKQIEDELEGVVREQISFKLGHLQEDKASLQKNEEELRKLVYAGMKGEADRDMQLRRLNREERVNEEMFMNFQQQLKEAEIKERSTFNEVRVLSKAFPPRKPIKPNKTLGLLVSLTAGVFLGFLVCILQELADTSFSSIEDIEEELNIPVLGIIPVFHTSGALRNLNAAGDIDRKEILHQILPAMFNHSSIDAEAFCNLRARLLHNKLEKNGKKVFLISSSSSQEGKSVVSLNIAAAIAATGAKTLLISCDLRRPALRKWIYFGDMPGITEALAGEVPVPEALIKASDLKEFSNGHEIQGVDNLWLSPAGRLPTNPAELIDSKKMSEIIEELKKTFDYVFFDTPPVLPIADALLLAPKVDGVLLVYQFANLPRRAVMRARKSFADMGVQISGIILNKVKTNQADVYHVYSAYHYRYFNRGEARKGKGEAAASEGGAKWTDGV